MVETTKPDMIMVTGDITSEKENYTAFKTFCTFMEDFKIPWGFVFGNHEGLDIKYEENEVLDPEKIADRQTLSDYLESLPNCIYEAGDEAVDGIFTLCRSEAERLSTLKMMVLLQLRILSVTEGRIQLQSAKSSDFMLNC